MDKLKAPDSAGFDLGDYEFFEISQGWQKLLPFAFANGTRIQSYLANVDEVI